MHVVPSQFSLVTILRWWFLCCLFFVRLVLWLLDVGRLFMFSPNRRLVVFSGSCLLCFRHPSERRYSLCVLFYMKTLFSDWQCLVRNHLLYFSALFSNIYRKVNFMAKTGSEQCNFYSKLDFGGKYYKPFFAFLYEF